MEKRLKIASWILIGSLLLPLFQQGTGLFFERILRGSYKIAELPSLTAEGWFAGSYQDSLEPALNDRFGFRNFFIRVNNQVAFSLYRKALANGVKIGKKNYLYETNYIKAQLGMDFLGDSLIESNVEKLKEIQDYFEKKETHFLVTFAVGKGSFYPEYFPDSYGEAEGPTNLSTYKKFMDSCKVNYIDFNQWFLEMKDTSRYSLYPKTGIHWSYYGMALVFDSLVNYLEDETDLPMPEVGIGNIKLSRKYRSSDRDIEQGMNLVFRINHEKMAYPDIIIRDEGIEKVKGVVIADSFYWGMHNMGFSNRVFRDGEFWYYCKQIIGNHLDGPVNIEDIDPLERLNDADVIIMMVTEATLMKFPYGIEEIVLERDSQYNE
ncbi:hypothetical protein ACFLT1_07625 [Bacteroidota bacterium]